MLEILVEINSAEFSKPHLFLFFSKIIMVSESLPPRVYYEVQIKSCVWKHIFKMYYYSIIWNILLYYYI